VGFASTWAIFLFFKYIFWRSSCHIPSSFKSLNNHLISLFLIQEPQYLIHLDLLANTKYSILLTYISSYGSCFERKATYKSPFTSLPP
jgi:hypothetical protein